MLLIYWKLFKPVTLGVNVLLLDKEQVLLIKKTYVSGWHLPGGGVKPKESLKETAERELREEVGCIPNCMNFIGSYSTFLEYKSDHVAIFKSESYELSESSSPEIDEIKYFRLDNLPQELSTGAGNTIRKYLESENCKGLYWEQKRNE